MLIPAAMQIESAVDMLKKLPESVQTGQKRELYSAMGASTASQLGVSFPITPEFEAGYALGLETARVVLAGTGVLWIKGIDPAVVL